jgi:hypothetical protein
MRVFGIGDLHLSSSGQKPMEVFGPEWAGHREKIGQAWRAVVGPHDLVLLCGDLSWAMTLAEAVPDLEFIGSLPGVKYFIRGNHDFWFLSPSRVRAVLHPSMRLIRFDAAVHGGVGICGVRAWPWPGHSDYEPARDEKHWRRAITRFRLSLAALRALDWKVAVAMFHYPPRDAQHESELCQMMLQAGIRYCIYGHLHGQDAARAFEGEKDGIAYRCVSADHVNFTPELLFECEG